MSNAEQFIRAEIPPSGPGCVECEELGSWWLHLRRCAYCGHIGCCDSSVNKHASGHAHSTGHRVICSYEPGETWFWDYSTDDYLEGPALRAPHSHPRSQTVPGPRERVPGDWERLLNS